MLQLIREELIGADSIQGIKDSIHEQRFAADRNMEAGVNIPSNRKFRQRADFALYILSKVSYLHQIFNIYKGAQCFEVTHPDSGDVVFCTAEELELLNSVSWDFHGAPIFQTVDISICERFNEQTFEDLNKPTTDTDLDISVWGDDGSMSNNEADKQALTEFGVYFNVLIFLDGCDTFYRTTKED